MGRLGQAVCAKEETDVVKKVSAVAPNNKTSRARRCHELAFDRACATVLERVVNIDFMISLLQFEQTILVQRL